MNSPLQLFLIIIILEKQKYIQRKEKQAHIKILNRFFLKRPSVKKKTKVILPEMVTVFLFFSHSKSLFIYRIIIQFMTIYMFDGNYYSTPKMFCPHQMVCRSRCLFQVNISFTKKKQEKRKKKLYCGCFYSFLNFVTVFWEVWFTLFGWFFFSSISATLYWYSSLLGSHLEHKKEAIIIIACCSVLFPAYIHCSRSYRLFLYFTQLSRVYRRWIILDSKCAPYICHIVKFNQVHWFLFRNELLKLVKDLIVNIVNSYFILNIFSNLFII